MQKQPTGRGPEGCVENGPPAASLVGYVSIQICALYCQSGSDRLRTAHFERNDVTIICETVHQGSFPEMQSIRPRSGSNPRLLCLTNVCFGQQCARIFPGLARRPRIASAPNHSVIAFCDSPRSTSLSRSATECPRPCQISIVSA